MPIFISHFLTGNEVGSLSLAEYPVGFSSLSHCQSKKKVSAKTEVINIVPFY